ncbi:1-deoxy-D-xylulose-5-phosphate synthase [Arthrobacter stackebrandtii]|uniref:1-deoxy-D-xylulose-5-phosphate synthase n=1 Tax=Arthrobacter stackebrandtii TaxID=272161 RepID=A0ABS4Z1H5_9MICC|nr:1-deoxy-D-xylulose-5-phosphate synthase [Arthrobacter stackebrandtii]MBP2414902.1 1-deoxy-D-xylulose-5-phosphate synthase [Arthrobacter stackebrandtii]PYH00926.1 1-deoxy-D-xylulose-5-phosphate synthase [Arthrobacter stackebrandtii]
MGLLETITHPRDLSKLSDGQMELLAQEIRDFLIANVSQTGGHLGPNLGVVELTLAIHRVFDSPRDSVVFDTGHQSYVHKLVTGRQNFDTLRQQGGLSGYPDRAESEHDIVESSHASSSLSWADGIARAHQLKGESDRYVVAVIGDGALTGGMTWEAINNIAADKDRKVVIVVNDNGRSYAPTVGGVADYLASLRPTIDQVRTHRKYEASMDWGKQRLQDGNAAARFIYKSLHAAKKGVKDWWAPQGLFDDLGMKYIGPVDGHDEQAMEAALTTARNFAGPVIVHAYTEKGRGYAPARADVDDQFHAVGVIDPVTGASVEGPSGASWTGVFGDEITKIAEERSDIVAITGAMLIPVGLAKFAGKFPDRVIDVGIAEQHAVTMAAGLAFGGLHPVVAIYATFLNRAFDQLLMDVALHKAGVTIVLDRAGVTGPDGPSHHGMWDLSMLQIVPGLHLAAPRDAERLREELREAVAIKDAPSVVRYSKGKVGPEVKALERLHDGVDVLARSLHETPGAEDGKLPEIDVLIVSVGAMSELALDVAQRIGHQGISSTVVDPRWVMPVPRSIVQLASQHRIVIVIEDGVRVGGVGSRIRQELRAAGIDTALNEVGLPVEFLVHGSRGEVLERIGLTSQRVAQDVVEQVLGTKVPFARPLPGQPAPRTGQMPIL